MRLEQNRGYEVQWDFCRYSISQNKDNFNQLNHNYYSNIKYRLISFLMVITNSEQYL